MNKLYIIGNLVKDPELRSTTDGTRVCGFTVAVNRPKTRKNKEENTDSGADFFNVNAWREKGENCAKYLTKGSKVAVIGRISLRTWEKDGKHGASLEVNAEEVEFLSRGGKSPDPSGMEIVETDELPY